MKPVVVIGAGLAGFAAALAVKSRGHDAIIVERAEEVGGRYRPLRGDGWLLEPHAPYFHLGDRALMNVIREVGLDPEVVALQGPVSGASDGVVHVKSDDFGGNRATLKRGWSSLFEEIEGEIRVFRNINVGALRWIGDESHFQLRDVTTGRALRYPGSDEVVEAGAIILAVPGTTAGSIAASSRFLQPISEPLSQVKYQPAIAAAYRLPKEAPPFAGITAEVEGSQLFFTVANECVPSRSPGSKDVVSVQVTGPLANELLTEGQATAAKNLFATARDALGILPDKAESVLEFRHIEAAVPTAGSFVSPGKNGIPTKPAGVPFALAGDYVSGTTPEEIAKSGFRAAKAVL